MSEAAVRQRIEDWAKAFRARDIDAILSVYAPGIVSFDIGPPLRYAGADDKRRAWKAAFAAYAGSIECLVTELNVATDGELAFAHSLNHVKGTLSGGDTSDLWLRWTACFRHIDDEWQIVHDHVSVPADLQQGTALEDLAPWGASA